MIILIGPSASGKTAISKFLTTNYNFKKFVTSTTRKPRIGEINSIDYNFLTLDTFKKKLKNDEFIETTFYNGNYYGTEKKLVNDNVVLIVELNGLKEFKKRKDSHIISYYLDSTENSRKERMKARGDDEEEIKKRISHDKFKFKKGELLPFIDVKIDTENKSIEEITKEIYQDYINKINKN